MRPRATRCDGSAACSGVRAEPSRPRTRRGRRWSCSSLCLRAVSWPRRTQVSQRIAPTTAGRRRRSSPAGGRSSSPSNSTRWRWRWPPSRSWEPYSRPTRRRRFSTTCSTERSPAGLAQRAGHAQLIRAGSDLWNYRLVDARRRQQAGFDYCNGQGLELYRLYLLADRARLELLEGRYAEAAEAAETVLAIHRTSISPRIQALCVLALVRARRGDPGDRELLDEARSLAQWSGGLWRIAPVAFAQAELAWLHGDDALLAETEDVVALAGRARPGRRRRGASPLACPRRARAARPTTRRPRPKRWAELGVPYEAALALADTNRVVGLRRAYDELQALGAAGAAARVARLLRERGERGVPRGPRRTTRANPAGLTRRELDVLGVARRGPPERRDRRAARRLTPHGRPPRVDDPAQARGRDARPGRRRSGPARPPRRADHSACRSARAASALENSLYLGYRIPRKGAWGA